MTLRLIRLACPRCGAQLPGEAGDRLFFCSGCGAGAVLEGSELVELDAAAVAPAQGRPAQRWLPAWRIDAEVSIGLRVTRDQELRRERSGETTTARRVVLAAFPMLVRARTRHALALLGAELEPIELPAQHEVVGGSLAFADAVSLVRHLVIGEEARKPDLLYRLRVTVTPTGRGLLALPCYDDGGRRLCAVTGCFLGPAE